MSDVMSDVDPRTGPVYGILAMLVIAITTVCTVILSLPPNKISAISERIGNDTLEVSYGGRKIKVCKAADTTSKGYIRTFLEFSFPDMNGATTTILRYASGSNFLQNLTNIPCEPPRDFIFLPSEDVSDYHSRDLYSGVKSRSEKHNLENPEYGHIRNRIYTITDRAVDSVYNSVKGRQTDKEKEEQMKEQKKKNQRDVIGSSGKFKMNSPFYMNGKVYLKKSFALNPNRQVLLRQKILNRIPNKA